MSELTAINNLYKQKSANGGWVTCISAAGDKAELEDVQIWANSRGYTLVPIEPNEKMLDKIRAALLHEAIRNKMYPQDSTIGPRSMMRDQYKAIIKAAGGE